MPIRPALAGTLLLLAACAGASRSAPARAAAYEVHAVRYGVLPDFPVAGLVAGADTARRIDVALMVWVARGGGRTVLVDAGFHSVAMLRQWRPRDFVRPSEAIGKLGVRPEEVTDVVVTHLHWDHAGGADLFPNARVWLQREEYDHYRRSEIRATRTGVLAEDLAIYERLEREGRLMLVDGDGREILPGITVHTGGRHTYASQYVAVRGETGTIVLASDNAYLYENLERVIPIAQTLDAEANRRALLRMREIASEPRLVVPGHDPEVFRRFPQPGGGVARIR